jgi:GH15 family glucan-1,4-alpha-glucosidase
VFGSLLDADGGGRFRIAAEGDDVVVRQLYIPDTAILVTRFMTPGGVGEVLDFMPVEDPERASDRHRLVRVVRCVRGQIRFVAECAPRFDYGRQEHELELTEQGAVFHTPTLALTLHGGGQGAMQRRGNDVRSELTVSAGQTGGVMLESAAAGPPRTMTPEELLGLYEQTTRFWPGWLAGTGSGSATPAGSSSPSSPTGSPSTGTSRMRASGRPAAAARTSPMAG